MRIPRTMIGAALASTSATIGGMTVVLTRYLMPESDPFSLPSIRYGIGALILLSLLYLLKKNKKIEFKDWIPVFILSCVFYVAFPWAFAAGLEHTTAARGAIVFTSQPVITLILGAILGIEKTTKLKILAISIALSGIIITLSDQIGYLAPNAWKGDLLMFFAAFCNSVYVLSAGKYIKKYGGFTFTAWPMLIGSSLMFMLALIFGNPLTGSLSFDQTGWIVLLILAIPGASIMVLLFMISINMATPTGITVTVGFNPLSAIILGAIILREPVSSKILIGFFCITCAVILANIQNIRSENKTNMREL
jgi:drug/metabolite transporter (DMT)-like permease